jgi:tetratricopeptide (TPR) repeat protein
MNIVQNDARKLEKYNDAIKMYNKALNYMQQKSEDMAIIQLKKATEINPKFIEAYNLLTLCYIYQKDNAKALVCIEKVLELDVTNKKALAYYNEIKKGAQRPLKIEKNVNTKATTKTYAPMNTKSRKKTVFSDITSFIIGAIVMAVFMYVLMVPSIQKNKDSKINQLTQTNETISKQLNEKTDENKRLSEQLEKEKIQLQQENSLLKTQVEAIEQEQKLQQVQNLYNTNKEAAAQLLLSLKDTEFQKPETKAAYETLKIKIVPELAKTYYNQGMERYSARAYSEAKVLLEKSLNLSTVETYSSDALYFSGRIDESNGDIASAKLIYQKLMDNYPNANQFRNAKARFEALG